MIVETLLLRLGGESGIDNAISAGDVLTLSMARSGYHVHTFRTYPAEIKGGPVMFQLRVGVRPVPSLGDQLDLLLAFNKEAWDLHHKDLRADGILVYDPGEHDLPAGFEGTAYGVPWIVWPDDLNLRKGKNLIALGALSALLGFDFPAAPGDGQRKVWGQAPRVRGEQPHGPAGRLRVGQGPHLREAIPAAEPPPAHESELVMSGNQAIVAGALAAGCRYFAGYPITPASDILEEMAKRLPALGGATLQTEDEIAAIGSVVGASIAGVKAMTATSGPGFSLMQELLGLATMAEVPVVVVNSMRAGPSTGMPTKMEQADLNIALYGGHGEAPRIVLAARSVEDCFYQAMQAFYLSETFQMPVVLLSDQSLSHRTSTLPMPDPYLVPVVERMRPSPNAASNYKRYELTESGISPMGVPGFDPTPFTRHGVGARRAGSSQLHAGDARRTTRQAGSQVRDRGRGAVWARSPIGLHAYGVPRGGGPGRRAGLGIDRRRGARGGRRDGG
jgi:2-oxoglutarate/2-oxoacid ferredoxin oxidoreductase subunit alpha